MLENPKAFNTMNSKNLKDDNNGQSAGKTSMKLESSETNTPNISTDMKIESDLHGNHAEINRNVYPPSFVYTLAYTKDEKTSFIG